MRQYHKLQCGEPQTYIVVSQEKTADGTGYLLRVRNSAGRTSPSRVFIPEADAGFFPIGKEITLIPWHMDIIAVKLERKDGKHRSYHEVYGLARNDTEAQAAANRMCQYLYDNAAMVADTPETRAAARAGGWFGTSTLSPQEFAERVAKLDSSDNE